MNQRFEYKTVEVYHQNYLPGSTTGAAAPESDGWRVIKMWKQHQSPSFLIVYERPFEPSQ